MSPRSRKLVQWPDPSLRILLASPDPSDHKRLPEILNQTHWSWSHARTCRHARLRMERERIAVVLCERDQSDGSWRDVLEGALQIEQPPSLIVCSRLADEGLWAEVLNLGGYDVLIKPFEREEVVRVVEGARRAWTHVQHPAPHFKTSAAGVSPFF